MKCNCNESCIEKKEELLSDIDNLYKPCLKCHTKKFKKAIPLKRQIKLSKLDANLYKCDNCRKRHIDIVMAHVLKILIENKQISESASLRQLGTPLITPAIYLESLPYLSEKSLVIITTSCDKETAGTIIEKVPEIKAILRGNIENTVGILNENVETNTYELLSGCDISCDIQNTDKGPIIIYKNQSKIHIEYPKKESQKIIQLKGVLEKYENPTVIDAMCGPGTLGIYALLSNAKKVLFNDIYGESLDALKTNLTVNNMNPESYEIRNENILNLADVLENHYDIALIDAFPDVDTSGYIKSLENVCDEVVII